jgi:hypothetical protein
MSPKRSELYFKRYDGKKLKKSSKQKSSSSGGGGKTTSHMTILLMGISVLIGEVRIYTTIPSWAINNKYTFTET